jgi:hypothetical protein
MTKLTQIIAGIIIYTTMAKLNKGNSVLLIEKNHKAILSPTLMPG